MNNKNHTALIVVDVQRDFMTGGALAVSRPVPETILPFVNARMASGDYARIVLTQDYHPADHCSFAVNLGVEPFTMGRTAAGRDQVAWPVHCVAGTPGGDFHPDLRQSLADAIIRKGTCTEYDSYSGFADDGGAVTGLAGYLKANDIAAVDVVGIATDYCVKATALGAVAAGLRTRVLLAGCAGVADDTVEAALGEMRAAGIEVVAQES